MKVSNFKLGIGFPLSFHLIPSAFFDSFITMEKPPFTYLRPDRASMERPAIDEMRNAIVLDAQAAGCTHLLMLDTDQMYPRNTVPRLLSPREAVVGARIRRRYPPFDNLMFRGRIGQYVNVPRDECLSGKLIEVDATGTGCLLFDMTVFRNIRPPWFESGKHNGSPVGEDFGFCAQLRKAGYRIYVDTAVYVAHLTQMGITDNFADIYERISAARQAAQLAKEE